MLFNIEPVAFAQYSNDKCFFFFGEYQVGNLILPELCISAAHLFKYFLHNAKPRLNEFFNKSYYSLSCFSNSVSSISSSDDGTVRIWSTEIGKCVRTIQNLPGLIVLGCDMHNLHEVSSIDKEILRQYGAIVD